jgi:Hypothetical glycosyl hydrolase 6
MGRSINVKRRSYIMPAQPHSVKYAMFFDFHTMKFCPDVGHGFDADKFANQLSSCGVDLIGFPAKCNQGFCYYDTTAGIRHPSLEEGRDLFGEIVSACRKQGITVNAYLNCGLSHEVALEHPEWNMLSPDGRILHPDIGDIGEVTPYMRLLCLNSPYRDYLMKLVSEVIDKYEVGGFLLDSFNGFPCVCPRCIKMMKKTDLDWRNPDDVKEFSRLSSLRLAEDLAELILKKQPHAMLNFLGIGAEANSRLATYMECECLPTHPAWGYDTLPIMSHYLRTISKGQVLNMTGRFYDWGDFGSLRAQAALEYDLFYGLANGMRPNIGDHLHPRMDFNTPTLERVSKVYANLRRFEPWFEGAWNLVEIGLVLPDGKATKTPAICGAVRMLSELKMQFDIVDTNSDWDKYSCLVLPDNVLLSGELLECIQKHLLTGKTIISTGQSGLDTTANEFVFPNEWGINYQGQCDYKPAYFQMHREFNPSLAEMPMGTYTQGTKVKTLPGTKILGKVIAPYFNQHWDGVYSYYYAPPDRETDLPFVTENNQVIHCAYPLFEGYYNSGLIELRKVFAGMLAKILPEPLLKTDESLPSYARAFVTAKPGKMMIHLLNYLPELRGKMLIVEEGAIATDVKLILRCGGTKVHKVFLAPDGEALPFEQCENQVAFTIEHLRGYALIEISMS